MKLSPGRERIKALIGDTVTLLCKNGLDYDHEFTIEGLVVITVDKEETFHASIRESFTKVDAAVANEEAKVEVRATSTEKPVMRKRRAGAEPAENISDARKERGQESPEAEACAKKRKQVTAVGTGSGSRTEPADKCDDEALRNDQGKQRRELRRKMDSSSPVVVLEPLSFPIETRSARKLAEQYAKVVTRRSAKKALQPTGKSNESTRKSISESKSVKKDATIGEAPSGERVSALVSPQRSSSRLAKSDSAKTKLAEDSPSERTETKAKLKTTEPAGRRNEEGNSGASQEGASSSHDVDSSQRIQESVSIDTRGSVLISSPSFGTSQRKFDRLSTKGKMPKPPILSSSPEYRRVTIPNELTPVHVVGEVSVKREEMQRVNAPESPKLVVGGRFAKQREGRHSEGTTAFETSLNVNGDASEEGEKGAGRKPSVNEPSPNSLNDICQRVMYNLDPLRVMSQISGDRTIKVNVGLGERPKFGNPLECSSCKLIFGSYAERRDHVCCAHPIPEGVSRLYRCDVCRAMFIKEDNLQKHVSVHYK